MTTGTAQVIDRDIKKATEPLQLSVIIPVGRRHDEIKSLYRSYRDAIGTVCNRFEFLYVLDGTLSAAWQDLRDLQAEGEPIAIVQLARHFGEATAIMAGTEYAKGEVFLILPAYHQVEPEHIPRVLQSLEHGDVAIGIRTPRIDARFNRMQAKILNWLMNRATGTSFHDLGCSVRAFRREVMDELPIYGEQHRYLPVLASHRGFRVTEVELPQSSRQKAARVHQLSAYPGHVLDILAVLFLVRFTKKPLRFFGTVGSLTSMVGFAVLAYGAVERLVWQVPLADRPILLLGSLLLVLGVQILALGLIGELIIFTHARHLKEYTIEKYVN